MSTGNRFGERIKKLRKEKGLALDAVAEGTGVSKPTLWALEKEPKENETVRDLGYSKVVKLAKFYNVSTDYLLGLETFDDMTPIEVLREERETLKQELSKLRKAVSDMNKILETI